MRHRQKRTVPPKRAMLALAVSISRAGDVRGHQSDGVAAPEVQENDEAAPTLGRVQTIEGGSRGGRQLNHNDVRTTDGENEGSFRLRLYWEDGYFWQDYPDEMWWCMGEFLSGGDLIRARETTYDVC
jgi:hypothetical protein